MRSPRWVTENRVLAFIQIALALGGSTLIAAVVHSLSDLSWLYLVAIVCFGGAGFALVLYRTLPARPTQLVAPGERALLSHRIAVLGAQLDHLHLLFGYAKETGYADAIENVFQLKIEPQIRNELGDPDLLRHFYDDTGFTQADDDGRETAVKNFIERRVIRLNEVLDMLRGETE